MKIIIDSREPENFLSLIKENVNKSIDLEISTQNLDIGDFHIYRNNDDEYPSIIIERKSLNDLISSIKDGRYNEQSFRLNNHLLHNHNIYYLIEGSIEFVKNNQNKQMIYSSIFTLSYFKGFSIINSYNINQSANIIIRFIEKLYKENTKNSFYNNNKRDFIEESKNYSEVIKAQKKSNITKENILEIMLMQIPGVSINVAQIISNNFKSLKNLIENLENNPDCLYNLKYSSESNRKFSKTTINNIKEYLLL
jgi:ERCC4-type nuclease